MIFTPANKHHLIPLLGAKMVHFFLNLTPEFGAILSAWVDLLYCKARGATREESATRKAARKVLAVPDGHSKQENQTRTQPHKEPLHPLSPNYSTGSPVYEFNPKERASGGREPPVGSFNSPRFCSYIVKEGGEGKGVAKNKLSQNL